jgi:hypothetical protein
VSSFLINNVAVRCELLSSTGFFYFAFNHVPFAHETFILTVWEIEDNFVKDQLMNLCLLLFHLDLID